MRRIALLPALLILALLLPAHAWADGGLGWGLRGIRDGAHSPARREAAISRAPDSRPDALIAGFGAACKGMVERGERERRPAPESPAPAPQRTGGGPAQSAARSRARSVQLRFLGAAPLRAAASRGIVGHQSSSAPPRPPRA